MVDCRLRGETVSEPSVPPPLMIFLRLAQHAVTRLGRLDLEQVALHRAHAVVEFGGQVIELEQLLRQDPGLSSLPHTVIPSWYQRPGYVGAMADLIEQELWRFEGEGRGNEGGSGGGLVVAQGTPEEVARVTKSHTGIYLQKLLNQQRAATGG